jgi:thermitase
MNCSDELNSYRLQFPDEASAKAAREALEGNNDIATVDSNYNVYRPFQPESMASDSLPPMNLKASGNPDTTKMIIGLVDTPVQGKATPYSEFILPSQTVVGNSTPGESSPTHGTSMLETILRGLSQAPQSTDGTPVRVLPIDVYGGGETTSTFDVAKGIIAAINGGSSIINLSLGSEGDSQVLHNAVKQAYEKGILVVAAAGNESTATATYPAAYSEVLAVTAGKNGSIASYANYGSFVDLVAPGSNLIYFNGKTYLTAGTSVSTAYISGLASGLAVKNGTKPQQVGSLLMNTFGRSGAK